MTEQKFLDEIRRCNRCGFCQDICPTYDYTKNEAQVARGRIRLIRLIQEGTQDWGHDQELTQILRSCLLCKACAANCPSGVPVDNLVVKAREKVYQANGMSLFDKTLYRGLLSRRERLAKVMGLARFYEESGIRWLVTNARITSLFKQLGYLESHLPQGLRKNARSQLPKLLKRADRVQYRVGYFLGCATDNFFSDIAQATILYLQKLGCEVLVPPVSCCGGPHRSAGDMEEFKRLAKVNMDYFTREKCDYIVSDCATCTSTLKEYASLFDDVECPEKVLEFAEKVLDLNEFIMNKLPLPVMKPLALRVTYHDPCHLARGLGVVAEPRILLKSIPGLDYVEMDHADRCCGGAGSYFITQSSMSSKILKFKVQSFRDTGAAMLATSCPACNMQLSAGLRQEGIQGRVLHPIQLLAASANLIEL